MVQKRHFWSKSVSHDLFGGGTPPGDPQTPPRGSKSRDSWCRNSKTSKTDNYSLFCLSFRKNHHFCRKKTKKSRKSDSFSEFYRFLNRKSCFDISKHKITDIFVYTKKLKTSTKIGTRRLDLVVHSGGSSKPADANRYHNRHGRTRPLLARVA